MTFFSVGSTNRQVTAWLNVNASSPVGPFLIASTVSEREASYCSRSHTCAFATYAVRCASVMPLGAACTRVPCKPTHTASATRISIWTDPIRLIVKSFLPRAAATAVDVRTRLSECVDALGKTPHGFEWNGSADELAASRPGPMADP